MRRSRRNTLARWLPNTPRYAWSSSTTMNRKFSKSFAHLGWCGRIPECSMSGLLSTTCARVRLVQLRHLVLGQRLGREQVERARGRVLQDRVEDRQVVTERLARGRRRGDDD